MSGRWRIGALAFVLAFSVSAWGQVVGVTAQSCLYALQAVIAGNSVGNSFCDLNSCSIVVRNTFACGVEVNENGQYEMVNGTCTVYNVQLVLSTDGEVFYEDGCIAESVGTSSSGLSPINSANSPNCPANSTINVDAGALGETIDLVGVPFSLTYTSDRFRAGFSYSTKTIGDGGWIPSNLEHYDTVSQILYAGDGGLRPVIAQATSTGGYYVANSDASEVYYFDSNGNHLYTKDALTKLTKYTFSYDSYGRLSMISDQFNNQTTFQYSTSAAGSVPGSTITMTAPFGQKTTLTNRPVSGS